MTAVSESNTLFNALRVSVDPEVASAIEGLVRDAPDEALNRVNVLDFAARHGLNEERVIAAFLHAARLGLFELSWNVLCPGCGGVLDVNASLKTIHSEEYHCAFCAAGYEPTLDEMVEVSFTVSPRVRHIEAHDPHTLPLFEYYRQMFWSTGLDLPADAEQIVERITLDALELPAGERATMSLTLPSEFVIVFDPVTHVAQFLEVKGQPSRDRQSLSLIFDNARSSSEQLAFRPGPLRISLDNRSTVRVLPTVWIACKELHELLGKRRPFLTAKRLLTNQTFRDVYRTDTLDIDQRLKITSLTFLFTDLRGSTELYERVGDLVAYDLVRSHFHVLNEVVASEAGAVVKTIGDAVMATFPTPDRAISAALRMREAMRELKHGERDLVLKIGIHEGPCLAVMLNERQDYFGQTVNIASRVQSLAVSRAIYATAPVVQHPQSASLLEMSGLKAQMRTASLRGIANAVNVFEIP